MPPKSMDLTAEDLLRPLPASLVQEEPLSAKASGNHPTASKSRKAVGQALSVGNLLTDASLKATKSTKRTRKSNVATSSATTKIQSSNSTSKPDAVLDSENVTKTPKSDGFTMDPSSFMLKPLEMYFLSLAWDTMRDPTVSGHLESNQFQYSRAR